MTVNKGEERLQSQHWAPKTQTAFAMLLSLQEERSCYIFVNKMQTVSSLV